jgi:hypothetical protein
MDYEQLRPFYKSIMEDSSTLGVLFVKKESFSGTHDFNALVLVITERQGDPSIFVEHRQVNWGDQITLYFIEKKKLSEYLLTGVQPRLFEWLTRGEIIFERDNYIQKLFQNLSDFPFHERKIRMGLEFGKLVKRFFEGKDLFNKGHYLDAYYQMLHCLRYFARLSAIEKGCRPELTLWNRVKDTDPEVYKIYEVLLYSNEPLEKRLELLLLAFEYYIHERTELGASHLLEIMEEKELWTGKELYHHPEIRYYNDYIFPLLEYLIDRKYVELAAEKVDDENYPLLYYKRTK